ncbi:carboxylesterase family protein [Kineosporia sp. NBRC 101731]|uniref:carboxylesterase/lipase family protein n=1 Tax=Kineosporia sp. NBRC 101731 TaxID=3032199 RepID=UPI0024A4D63D|nr:carboxylesterase family protein [Kineosporia sp. NBRC 101731]GLY31428.1 carboxylic ester hydrolase [Kineosporia sp. NBRC 101731]
MSSVQTTLGRVRGTAADGVLAFRGIPYATNSSGADRFAAPIPFPAWSGERDARAFGPTSPQPDRGGAFDPLDLTPFFGPGWVAGDLPLTVNVWTPSVPSHEPLPVLVFVHGGAFVAGSTAASLYDGAAFARAGIVCVTVNYRLGVPGWLHLPDAPANRGLLDVLAALRWVQREIGSFGGDPGRVTLAGQSAGAMIVAAALADQRFAGTFGQAIVASGSGLGALLPAQASLVTERVAYHLGIGPTASDFATIDDATLIDSLSCLTGLDLRLPGVRHPLAGITPFAPVLDEQPAVTIGAGRGIPAALLLGATTHEGNLYTAPVPGGEAEALAVAAAASPGGSGPADPPHTNWDELRSAILTEAVFREGTRALSAASVEARNPTFEYEFTWPSAAIGGTLGAAHGVDLPFVFGRAGAADLRGDRGLLGPEGGPARLEAEMHGAWIRFVTYGKPGWDATAAGWPTVRRFG